MRARIRHNTDEEEAAVQRGIALDPDNPEWTAADFAAARPAREVIPPEVYNGLVEAQQKRARGPGKKPPKVLLTLRLEPEIVERLRATGPGWQVRAAEALRNLTATPRK